MSETQITSPRASTHINSGISKQCDWKLCNLQGLIHSIFFSFFLFIHFNAMQSNTLGLRGR